MLSESFKYLNYSTQLSFSTAILFIWPLTPELFQGPESQAHWACHMWHAHLLRECTTSRPHHLISYHNEKNKKPTTTCSNWNFKILKQKWKSEMGRDKQSYGLMLMRKLHLCYYVNLTQWRKILHFMPTHQSY